MNPPRSRTRGGDSDSDSRAISRPSSTYSHKLASLLPQWLGLPLRVRCFGFLSRVVVEKDHLFTLFIIYRGRFLHIFKSCVHICDLVIFGPQLYYGKPMSSKYEANTKQMLKSVRRLNVPQDSGWWPAGRGACGLG